MRALVVSLPLLSEGRLPVPVKDTASELTIEGRTRNGGDGGPKWSEIRHERGGKTGDLNYGTFYVVTRVRVTRVRHGFLGL